jgi:hypothetical protein
MAALENAIREELEVIELECKHYFAHGTYTRELWIPKGVVLTGHIHRNSCINIIPVGRILVATDEGDKEVSGPTTFVSGPGVKKAGYALEDTIWINVMPNHEELRDIPELEAVYLYPSYEALEHEQTLKLEEL